MKDWSIFCGAVCVCAAFWIAPIVTEAIFAEEVSSRTFDEYDLCRFNPQVLAHLGLRFGITLDLSAPWYFRPYEMDGETSEVASFWGPSFRDVGGTFVNAKDGTSFHLLLADTNATTAAQGTHEEIARKFLTVYPLSKELLPPPWEELPRMRWSADDGRTSITILSRDVCMGGISYYVRVLVGARKVIAADFCIPHDFPDEYWPSLERIFQSIREIVPARKEYDAPPSLGACP